MTMAVGSRFGPFEVGALLGAGGMGVVYRARDTRLHRDVALKVLPETFAHDPDRLARFKREAQMLASLSHQHIAGIFGFEEFVGGGALVLELVEGPTLAERIAHGPIPIDDALPIAAQIVDAIEAAHDHGVIHRDLKPANIKLTNGGAVKVLDFGLAKALDQPMGEGDVTTSPTITSPAMTRMGAILGTAAYMSPEQAKGKPLDKRTDIWSFGCVLFEMLTGTRAFRGEDITETLASVIRSEPDWTALPPTTPSEIRTLLRRCLQKDRRRRLADIADARHDIDESTDEPDRRGSRETAHPAVSRKGRVILPAIAALLALLTVAASFWAWRNSSAPSVRPLVQFAVQLPFPFPASIGTPIAIARDGTHIVYVVENGRVRQLYSRALDQLQPRHVPGGEASGSIFLSPDGQWVGFNDARDGALKKVNLLGGPAVTISQIGSGQGGFRGASWGRLGMIVFATIANPSLMIVPEGGGVPRALTHPKDKDEAHAFPYFLPSGDLFLFGVRRSDSTNRIAVASIHTGEHKVLLDGHSPRYAASGHILFLRDDALWAVAFDAETRELRGDAVPVLQSVRVHASGLTDIATFDVSENGTLVYAVAGREAQRFLVWVDRQGTEEPVPAPGRAYTALRISPDGSRVAIDLRDQDQDIWTWEFEHPGLVRITHDKAPDIGPVWSQNGRHLFFVRGALGIFSQLADGTQPAEKLTQSDMPLIVSSASPDGNALIVRESGAKSGSDLGLITISENSARRRLLAAETFNESNGEISPNGRWLVYESDETGQSEVYVRPYPNVDSDRSRVSIAGGTKPMWARSGRELFYLGDGGTMFVVPVADGATFSYGAPVKLFQGAYFQNRAMGARSYDVHPDGKRFLMIKESENGGGTDLVVFQNWLERVRQQAPIKN